MVATGIFITLDFQEHGLIQQPWEGRVLCVTGQSVKKAVETSGLSEAYTRGGGL